MAKYCRKTSRIDSYPGVEFGCSNIRNGTFQNKIPNCLRNFSRNAVRSEETEEGEEGEEGVEGETRVARNLPKISHDGRWLSCPKPPAPSMSKTVPMWAGLQFANDNDMVF